jgi:signal recognition particle subunit SRP54
MRQMSQMTLWQRLKMVTGLGQMGAFLPGGLDKIQIKSPDTQRRKSARERAEERKRRNKKKRR